MLRDKNINNVFETEDYNRFKFLKGNRNINLSNLKNLDKSISKNYLKIPIIVNENYEIIDGQHRFVVLKEKELPITYIMQIGYGVEECELLNTTTRTWNHTDYLYSYCELGYKNYIVLKDFMEENNLSLSNARNFLELSSNDGISTQKFKNGEFIVRDLEKSQLYYKQYCDFKEVEPFKSTLFLRTLIAIFNNKNYNHERMVQKLKYLGYKIKTRSFMSEYQEVITDVYNYKVKESEKVYFR